MSDYGDGNFMDMVSHWSPPPSPGLSEIFATLDQTYNGLNPISDAFLQTNQPEQRPSLVDRVAARVGRKIPPLRTQNMSPFAPFKNPKTVPLVINISPGWSPSLVLHSPSRLISPYSFSDDELPETVENSGDDLATTMIFNNSVPSQPTHFDLPLQEDSYVIPTENIPSHVDPIGAPLVPSFESEVADDTDITKLLSLDNESKSEDKEYNEDEDKDEDEDGGSSDEQEGEPPSPKRRKYEESNTITTTRTSKVRKVTHHMENEEDQPSDDYRWRKYGQKVIKGNPNPRSYYKCSHKGCNVKKHVQRGADDVKTLVVTYDGTHEHPKPVIPSNHSSGPKNRSGSSVPAPLGGPPFSSFSAAQDMRLFPYPSTWTPFPYPSALGPQDKRPFPSWLNPGVDMTHLYMSGLSKLPPVNQNHGCMGQNDEPWVNQNYGCMGQNGDPWVNQNHECMGQNGDPWVNQNHGFMDQNNEPKTDHVIPDGTEVYKGIMERLMANYNYGGVKR